MNMMMKKNVKRLLIAVVLLLTLLMCAGYSLLGYALRPADLAARSRNLEESV